MSVYVVISGAAPLDEVVAEKFNEQNRSQVMPGVWFVRSERVSTADVVNDLGIGQGGRSGIVVAAQYYNGVGPADLVEKLVGWRAQG